MEAPNFKQMFIRFLCSVLTGDFLCSFDELHVVGVNMFFEGRRCLVVVGVDFRFALLQLRSTNAFLHQLFDVCKKSNELKVFSWRGNNYTCQFENPFDRIPSSFPSCYHRRRTTQYPCTSTFDRSE